MEMEGPPLWVWAIVVGAIIASKFIYRWQMTKKLSKDTKYSDQPTNRIRGNSATLKNGRLIDHKYVPKWHIFDSWKKSRT
jgi:hypothetical protein